MHLSVGQPPNTVVQHVLRDANQTTLDEVAAFLQQAAAAET